MANAVPETHEPSHDDVFLSVNDLERLVTASSRVHEKAEQEAKKAEEAAYKAHIAELKKPVEIPKKKLEEAMERFQRAAEQGQHELMVFSFPRDVCDDYGRAINNQLPGWPDTLVGAPRSIYEVWKRDLKDKGYRFYARVLNYDSKGRIGDIGLFIRW